MKKLYIFTGQNKDPMGRYRSLITETVLACQGGITEEPAEADGIAVLGGDGTMMRAAHIAVRYEIPMIGINLGRVGFIPELEKDEISLLAGFYNGNYSLESRMLLSVSVNGGEETLAFNDAVIHSVNTHMVHLTLSRNGDIIGDYRGDGLIFCTPTGSTAYSMSAGGPAIDPRLECICVTPICPQALTARPYLFDPNCELSADIEASDCMLTVDGGEPTVLNVPSQIRIRKSNKSVQLIHLKTEEFYGIIKKKMINTSAKAE